MEIKYIPVHFSDGQPDSSPVVTQWDRGQVLKITGLSLPAAAEFHFGNPTTEQLVMVAGITEDDVTRVQIPNSMLCEPHNIYLYIYVGDDNAGRTVYRIDLNMRPRLCPEEISTDPDDPHYLNGLSELIESASTVAAQVQAIADTLSPADAHYDPESWIAQSGTAVAEAVGEAVREAKDYTDEQISNIMIMGKGVPEDTASGKILDGDFAGQFYLDTTSGDLYQFCLPDNPYNQRWLRVINQNGAERLKYEYNSIMGLATNVKEALDLLLGKVALQVSQNEGKIKSVEGNLAVNYYTKEETDNMLSNEGKKEYEHIATITVAPDEDGSLPTNIIFSADSEGKPFELTDFFVSMTAGFTDGASSAVYMKVNNAMVLANASVGFNASALRCSMVRYHADDDGCIRVQITESGAATGLKWNAQMGIKKEVLIPATDTAQLLPVTKIDLYTLLGTAKTWIEGSTFELWGVKK